MSTTKVKICGLTRREDALHAAGAGADYLGVVLVPGSPRAVTPQSARALISGIEVPAVMVVADMDFHDLLEAAEVMEPSVIQLHGREDPETVARVSDGGPWEVWKALAVREPAEVVTGLEAYEGIAQALVLDGWHPDRLGGTGTAFPWAQVKEIRGLFPPGLELVAAGGLVPGNVAQAIRYLRPQVVDVSSGVERVVGTKEETKVEAFIRNVRNTDGGGAG